jgi:hypothetical protein
MKIKKIIQRIKCFFGLHKYVDGQKTEWIVENGKPNVTKVLLCEYCFKCEEE